MRICVWALSTNHLILVDRVGKTTDGLGMIVGEETLKKCSPIWDLNAEGEIYGSWRDLGVPGLWSVAGKDS